MSSRLNKSLVAEIYYYETLNITWQTGNLYVYIAFLKVIAHGYERALHASGPEEGEHDRHKEVFYIGMHSEWFTWFSILADIVLNF